MRGSWFENDYSNHVILLDFTPSVASDIGTVLSNNRRVDPRKA
jgi:hypothetical protein